MQDHRIVYSNQAALDIFGYQVGDIVGRETSEWTKRLHPEDMEQINLSRNTWEASSQASERYEFRMLGSDGETRWLEILRTETEYNGRPAIQFSILDRTERKMAEEAYRETMERYQALAEAAQDMIYIIDRENKLLYANEHTAAAAGETTGRIDRKKTGGSGPPDLREKTIRCQAQSNVNRRLHPGGRPGANG